MQEMLTFGSNICNNFNDISILADNPVLLFSISIYLKIVNFETEGAEKRHKGHMFCGSIMFTFHACK